MVAGLLPIIGKSLETCYYKCLRHFDKFTHYYCRKKENKILLSYFSIIRYGRMVTELSDDISGVLFYLKENMNNFDDLYSLVHDPTIKKFNEYDEVTKCIPIYRVDQYDKILFHSTPEKITSIKKPVINKSKTTKKLTTKKAKKLTINTKTKSTEQSINHKLYLRCYQDNERDTNSSNDEKKSDLKVTTHYHLELTSNTMSLHDMFQFIQTQKKKYQEYRNQDVNQYIYTYVGTPTKSRSDEYESSTSKFLFRKEKFSSFSDFSALYGDKIRKIESMFDFFVSPEGVKWYEDRNLPYQMTMLLHGLPGTGKSAIAAAIAKKYKLTIVRFNLGAFSTNQEFIEAFKTTKFESGGKKYEYNQLLYLFDEVDTQHNILLDRQLKDAQAKKVQSTMVDTLLRDLSNNQSISETNLKTITDNLTNQSGQLPVNITTDSLSLGTILEEMSGINQMWGRKMIFITNYPEKLDKAFMRPCRIDYNCSLSYSDTKDIISIIQNFYRNVSTSQLKTVKTQLTHLTEQDPPVQFTAAEITNLCKTHDTVDDLLTKLNSRLSVL